MSERSAKLSYSSLSEAAPSKTYFPTIEVDLKKFPEFDSMQFGDKMKLNIGVRVSKISVDKNRKCLVFDIETIDINDADASYSKLVNSRAAPNEADRALANLQSMES